MANHKRIGAAAVMLGILPTLASAGENLVGREIIGASNIPAYLNACNGIAQARPSLEAEAASLNKEVSIVSGFSGAEISIEIQRYCGAIKGLEKHSASVYSLVAACRDARVPNMQKAAHDMGEMLLTHRKQLKDTGC